MLLAGVNKRLLRDLVMEPAVYVLFNAYGYNARSELVLAAKNAEDAKEHEYGYDDIGNRTSSSDLGTTRAYTANSLNQYTEISTLRASAPPRETFIPQFDDDGNQTLIRTRTGTWSVAYNGENRPILWECGSTNITMSFDRMGRRVSYTETVGVTTNAHRTFVYDNYLCIQKIEDSATVHYSQSPIHCFVWDPTEPVATRPLVWQHNGGTYFYTHDGNKNVSELVDDDGSVVAHYEYAPFGDATVAAGNFASSNPFRFSSEYADDALGLVYYNYRHYEPVTGRWMSRDKLESYNEYLFNNLCVVVIDFLGASPIRINNWDWYNFALWYWLGFGKPVDINGWSRLDILKSKISNSIDLIKEKVPLPKCSNVGTMEYDLYGSVPDRFSIDDTALSWFDAIGNVHKVFNQGTLYMNYSCHITQTCDCCIITGEKYRIGGIKACNLTFFLHDRFANPTDKISATADNYDARHKCFSDCGKRFTQWGKFFNKQYWSCIHDCDKRFPSTDLPLAIPYNIFAVWHENDISIIPPQVCK